MKRTTLICILALCLPLLGCGQKEETGKPAAEPQGSAAFSLTALPVHEEVRFDLDGDGGEDTVVYSLLDDAGQSFRLEANGTAVDEDGVYPVDTAYIIDLDGVDPYHEVAVSETGMSDDYMVHIFRYDGEKWHKLEAIFPASSRRRKIWPKPRCAAAAVSTPCGGARLSPPGFLLPITVWKTTLWFGGRRQPMR